MAIVKATLFPFRTDLETIDETGAQPLRLAGGGERERPLPEWFIAPAWSPDGSKIVFSGMARSFDSGLRGVRLYLSGAEGDDLRPLRGTHGADEPVVSTDGTTVAFARYLSQPRMNRRGERKFVVRGSSIWLADLAGGAPRRITPERIGLYMLPKSFSPDGSVLLASRAVRRKPWEVLEVRLGTGRVKVLLRHAMDPVYSPDGSKIALVRFTRVKHRGNMTAAHLFTINATGGGLRRLTDSPRFDFFQSWDPSGERLAFVRYPRGGTELEESGFGDAVMEVNADGTCLRTLMPASPFTAFFGAAWQPGPGREAGRIEC